MIMKHIHYPLLNLLFLALTISQVTVIRVTAQDNRTLNTSVADLLAQVPADNRQQLDEQMQALLGLGKAGLQIILEQIIPPGTGDDTKPRIAVESLSRYLSRNGMEDERLKWETILLEEIHKRENRDVQRFLITTLNHIGGDASLHGLAPYLTDPDLQDPAIRVIRDANPDAAAALFADVLEKFPGNKQKTVSAQMDVNMQIALVNAIGDIGDQQYADAITRLAGSADPQLQRSVLTCLAKLGHPASFKVLANAAKKTGYMPEPTRATSSLLTYALRVSELGNHSLSLKICKNVNKKCKVPEQLHFKIDALITAAGNDNIENSVSLLTGAMQSDYKAYRMAAIRYAAEKNSPVAPWITQLNATGSNEVKSEIIYLFGILKQKETVKIVTGYMSDSDSGIRQQAVKSLALIQGSEAVPLIINYLISHPTPPDTETARAALLQTTGKKQLTLLTEGLKQAPEGARVVLTEVIAEQRDPSTFGILYHQIGSTGQVSSVSLENIYLVSSREHLDDLMILFDQLENKDEKMHIEKAIVEAINSSHDRSAATKMVLDHAAGSSRTDQYIGILATVGGKEALETVFSAYNTGNEAVRKEAFNGLVKSDDIMAATHLYEICAGSPSASERGEAFESYVRIVRGAPLPDDQKLLLLRKIESLSPGADHTRTLIRALGGTKTFLSAITLSKYLDGQTFRNDAAMALISVILPDQGGENGMDGKIIRKLLIRSLDLLTGQDAQYLKIDVENYLEKMPEAAGFVPMFNGKDLTGWQGLAADPITRRSLTPEALHKLQKEANEKVKENWSVRDNCIVFNGHGSNLCSVKEYGSFELIVDWRITKEGDSGIYLRGSPQVQIWDTSRVEVGAQVGSGGLYNNQAHESKPLVVADNPVGDWNTFRITMIGDRVTVYLNGQLVVDNVVMDNYWDRSIPIFPTGSVELQAHGTNLAFRDIYIRELDTPVNMLTPEEKAEGFLSLFNGKDLAGWTGENHSYAVEDGTIVIRPTKGGGNLYTENEYSDFIFRFEFKLTPAANNGLGIRTETKGDAAYVGYEIQILDNSAPVYAHLKPYQYHGSVYGIIPAKRGFQKPVGEWNSEEVYIKGDNIRVTLNGTVIVDGNLKEASRNGTMDGKEHPGLKRTRGHIGFLGHGSVVWFRNIRIREL